MSIESSQLNQTEKDPAPSERFGSGKGRPENRERPSVRRISNLWEGVVSHQGTIADVALILLVAAYTFLFGLTSILSHETFGTWAYDFGIFDQGLWLISRGKVAFNTVRGLHQFGDHASFIMYLLAPSYWIWEDANAILFLRSLGLAFGAVPIYWIAQEKLNSVWLALALSALYLLNPALQNLNLDFGHSETFVPVLLLFAFWAILKGRVILYGIFCLLALLCKEDVSITVFFLGLYVARFYNRKAGVATSLFSFLWFLLVMKVSFRYFNQFGFIRFSGGYWFSSFYSNMFNLKWYVTTFINAQVGNYLVRLFAPLLFLPLFSPAIFSIAVPAITINILGGSQYLVSIDYHYTTSIIPFLFLATISSLSRLSKPISTPAAIVVRRKRGWFLFGFKLKNEKRKMVFAPSILAFLLLGITLASQLMWSKLPLTKAPRRIAEQVSLLKNSNSVKAFNEAIRQIPADAAVSADYLLLPHLSHREMIYMFPNPFLVQYWGINGEEVADPSRVDFIIAHRFMVTENPSNKQLIETLIQQELFKEVYSKENIILYQRVSRRPKLETISTNLLANPTGKEGFRSWTFGGWKNRCDVVPANEVETPYWQFTWVEPGAPNTTLESDPFPIKGSRIYSLSADVWTGGQQKGIAKVRVDWYNEGKSLIGEAVPSISPPSAVAGWRSRSVRMYAPAQAAYAKVKLILDHFPQTTDTRFRHIKFEEGAVSNPFEN